MRRQYRVIVATLLLGCGSDGGLATKAVDVSGTWGGTLTYQTAARTVVTPLGLTIVQTGSQVTGKMSGTTGAGAPSTGTVTGTQTGSSLSLTLTGSKSTLEDCDLYPVTLTFDVGTDALTLKSISGPDCRGDNMGGHRSLDPITGGSLTMKKQ